MMIQVCSDMANCVSKRSVMFAADEEKTEAYSDTCSAVFANDVLYVPSFTPLLRGSSVTVRGIQGARSHTESLYNDSPTLTFAVSRRCHAAPATVERSNAQTRRALGAATKTIQSD